MEEVQIEMHLIGDEPSPEWAIFLSLNLGFPMVFALISPIWGSFPTEVRLWVGIGGFIALAALNTWRLVRVSAWRWIYGVILALNTISFVVIGSISVFTGVYGALRIIL